MKDNGQIFEATVFVVKGWESFVELKNILMRDLQWFKMFGQGQVSFSNDGRLLATIMHYLAREV